MKLLIVIDPESNTLIGASAINEDHPEVVALAHKLGFKTWCVPPDTVGELLETLESEAVEFP